MSVICAFCGEAIDPTESATGALGEPLHIFDRDLFERQRPALGHADNTTCRECDQVVTSTEIVLLDGGAFHTACVEAVKQRQAAPAPEPVTLTCPYCDGFLLEDESADGMHSPCRELTTRGVPFGTPPGIIEGRQYLPDRSLA